MPDVALIVVNYQSAELAVAAVASARVASSDPLEVVIVDNSCDPEEERRLERAGADQLIVATKNLGYAGGANLGIEATSATQVVVSNPDVVFREDSIDLLCGALDERTALAGPQFEWDDAGIWKLPPADLLTRKSKLSQILATRSRGWAEQRLRDRLRRRIEFWRRSSVADIDVVSGAVMAIDRRRLDEVGGFDTRYRLYFEEIDLMRSLVGRGGSLKYVPEARCRHLFSQSARASDEHHAKWAESEQLYLQKWFGPWVLEAARLSAPVKVTDKFEVGDHSMNIPLPETDREYLIEAASVPDFESAGGTFVRGGPVSIPPEVWTAYQFPNLYVRVVDPESLEELGRWVMEKTGGT